MRRVVRQVKVKNARSDRFTVTEVELVEDIGGRLRKLRQYQIETGEAGIFIDANTFRLDKSGELLSRVRRVKERR